ncbi:MAG: twin-arginine translocation signal domain-containing protein [Candidatus Moranbacteria bacterium]|nr:twin-arginine translocation signal domain-containing protein [Candidatus Moranbacteria bacterium]
MSNKIENPRENGGERKPISRRDFLKLAGFTGVSFFTRLPFELGHHLEASELKEDSSWREGVYLLLKDVFESEVETTGTFVQLKNGSSFWLNILDGNSTEIVIDPAIILKKIKKKNKNLDSIV